MGGAKEYDWSLVMLVGIVGLVGVVAIMQSFSSTEPVSFLAQPSSGADAAVVGSAALPVEELAAAGSPTIHGVLASQGGDFAVLNGVQRLGEDEFAIIAQPSPSLADDSDGLTRGVATLSDGTPIPFAQGDAFTIIEGDAKTERYIDAAGASLHSYAELDDPAETIPYSVRRKASQHEKIPIIIMFDLPSYYERGQSAEHAKRKEAAFQNAKAGIAHLAKSERDLRIINGIAATVDAHALEGLARNPHVKRIENNVEVKVLLDASVPQINAPRVWSLTDVKDMPLTGHGMRIAILDTGVDYTHPDLGGCFGPSCKVVAGYDFANNDPDPMDDHGHGTHVAATAAGKGLLKGVAPDAQIYAYKVMTANGEGYSDRIIAAIERSADPNADGDTSDHVDVVSMSLGGPGNPDDSMARAVDSITALGVVSTIAAGNSGPAASTIGSPGTARTAITVAASCKKSQIGSDPECMLPIAGFSSRGPLIWNSVDIRKPDLAAPGRSICAARWELYSSSTCFDSAHVRISGTSMATPHVAGAAALIRQAYPDYAPAQVKERLKMTAADLGLEYNIQGAGEINLSKAIPVAAGMPITPGFWEFATSPSVKQSVHTQTFAVKAKNAGISSMDVSFDFTGVPAAVSADKMTVQVPNNTSDALTITIAVDNDLAQPGAYFGRVIFTAGGVYQGSLPVFITVSPTVELVPSMIDYGINPPASSAETWQSTRQVTLRNLRTDTAVTVRPFAVQRVGVTINAPASVTIPAGGSVPIDTTMTVVNAQVPNGIYEGKFGINTSTGPLLFETKFVKYYMLRVTERDSRPGVNIVAHNKTAFIYRSEAAVNQFYFANPGPYDVFVFYGMSYDQACHNTYVIKENIMAVDGLAEISVGRYDAENSLGIIPTTSDGRRIALIGNYDTNIFFGEKSLTRAITAFCGTVEGSGKDYASDFSENYRYVVHGVMAIEDDGKVLDIFAVNTTGLSGNKMFANTPADFKSISVYVDPDAPLTVTGRTLISSRGGGGTYYGERDVPSYESYLQQVNSLAASELPFYSGAYYSFEVNRRRYGCSSTSACPTHLQSPGFLLGSSIVRQQNGQLPAPGGRELYVGLGPSVWTGKFWNNQTHIQLMPGVGRTPLIRQDYTTYEYDALPFTLTGPETLSRTLPAYLAFGSPAPVLVMPASGGQYVFTMAVPYIVRGQSLQGEVRSTFDTTLSDPNPPTLRKLYVYSGSMRSAVYDPSLQNRFEVEFNPAAGTLANASASYSTNGATFVPLPLTVTYNGTQATYFGTLPALSASMVTVRVEAADAAGNTFSYAFQMPRGPARILVPTNVTPTITVEKVGTGTGTVTGPGISCGGDCSEKYPAQTIVNLVAVAAPGSKFISWWPEANCRNPGSCNVFLNGSKTIYARFDSMSLHTLSVSKSGTGMVTGSGISSGINCGSMCTAVLADGDQASLIASPAAGYVFAGWSGACAGTESCIVLMSSDKAVSATFVPTGSGSYALSVSTSGGGTVTGPGVNCGTDCTESYASGTSVTLTATPAAGYTFGGWSGACAGTGSCSVLMDASKSVTATFVPSTVSYTLSVSKSGSGTVTGPGVNCGTDCSESYAAGTTVTLSATPASGYTFAGWSGSCAGTGSCAVTMTANKAVSATFSASSGDATPPHVWITSPSAGTVLPAKGNVKLQASASDASGIYTLMLAVDGTTVKTCTGVTSCRYGWRTTDVGYGAHTISATATDNSGLRAMTSIIVTK